MKRNLMLIGMVLATVAGCGDGRTEEIPDEGAVPEGAIPAPVDYPPEAPGMDAAAALPVADTAPGMAPAPGSDTSTTGPDARNRIQPR